MLGYDELVNKLKEIKKMGYVKTHRSGNTGIGKTLEDLLGIRENNIPGPNAKRIELKSARKNTTSMLTLFTKSPLPRRANSKILSMFGYETPSSGGRKRLHTTVNAVGYNRLRGRVGFKIDVRDDRIELVTKTGGGGLNGFINGNSKKEPEGKMVLGYWDHDTLKRSFERKLPKIMYVKAEAIGDGANEKFWYNEAWLLSGFSFGNFKKLLKEGVVLVDIRIGQYLDGSPHDHGTGFRVHPNKLELCFQHRERIM